MMLVQQAQQFVVRVGRFSVRSRRIKAWVVSVLLVGLALALQGMYPDWPCWPKVGAPILPTMAILIFVAAMLCEFMDSSLGMGYGTTLTPVLLLAGFEPLQVVPCVLLSECITGLTAALLHHRDGNVNLLHDRQARRTALWLTSLSILGAVAAATLAVRIPKAWLAGFIAAIIVSMGLLILCTARRQLAYRPVHIVIVGLVAAFNKGLSGGGYGPLVTSGQLVSGLSGRQAVAITSLAEGLTCAVGLIAYWLLSTKQDWSLAVPLTLGALLSVPLATLTVRKLPETAIRGGVGIATCLLGLLMVMKLFA